MRTSARRLSRLERALASGAPLDCEQLDREIEELLAEVAAREGKTPEAVAAEVTALLTKIEAETGG
jgi:hypothetical protein